MKTLNLFFYQLKDSYLEIKHNNKIYFSYIALLSIVALSRRLLETYLPNDLLSVKLISEILFSFLPILIISKILYVIKIRQNGVGEYKTIVLRYLIYNFCYFGVAFLCLSLPLAAFYFTKISEPMFVTVLATMVCSLPLIYVMVYFSLSPIVAIFEDYSVVESFKQSKKLTQKKFLLVLINHLLALVSPIGFLCLSFIQNKEISILISTLLALPDALMTILIVLTTVRVYLYLSELD